MTIESLLTNVNGWLVGALVGTLVYIWIKQVKRVDAIDLRFIDHSAMALRMMDKLSESNAKVQESMVKLMDCQSFPVAV